MNKYTITFHGRLLGAIGICYKITDSVVAKDKQQAIIALYDKYDTVHLPEFDKIEKVN